MELADDRNAHQDLIVPAAALDGRNSAGRQAEADGKQHGASDNSIGRRKQSEEFASTLWLVRNDVPKSRAGSSRRNRGIVARPAGRGRAHGEIGQALGRDAVLADPHLDRIARHQTGSPRK